VNNKTMNQLGYDASTKELMKTKITWGGRESHDKPGNKTKTDFKIKNMKAWTKPTTDMATDVLFIFFFIWGRSLKGCALFWQTGLGTAAYLHLKIHARKQHVLHFTQKWTYTTWCNKWSVGNFELNFTDTFFEAHLKSPWNQNWQYFFGEYVVCARTNWSWTLKYFFPHVYSNAIKRPSVLLECC